MNIDIEAALEKVRFYEENDMVFSAMYLWEKIVRLETTEYRKFKYADALRLCGYFLKSKEIFLSVQPGNIPAQYRYIYFLYFGQLYMDMGDIKMAKASFLQCLDYENCDTVPYIFLSNLLNKEDDNWEAIYYLKTALDKEGDTDEVYYNLAFRLAIIKDFEGALKAINQCLYLSPDYPNALALQSDIKNYLSFLSQ